MNLTPIRRATAAAAALSLCLAVTACGGDEPDAATDEPTSESSEPADDTESEDTEDAPEGTGSVLSEEQLTSALLTPADLPGGYVEEPDDGEEDSGGFEGSCLEEIGELTDQPQFEADEEVEATYLLEGDAGQSSVESEVESYADEQQISEALALFTETVAGCTEASGTSEDGLEYDLEVLSDDTVSLEGVDEQARVAVRGTLTSEGLELPVDIGFNVARVGNNLVAVSTFDIGEVGDGIVPQTDMITQVSVNRLAEIS